MVLSNDNVVVVAGSVVVAASVVAASVVVVGAIVVVGGGVVVGAMVVVMGVADPLLEQAARSPSETIIIENAAAWGLRVTSGMDDSSVEASTRRDASRTVRRPPWSVRRAADTASSLSVDVLDDAANA
jgi:hypothetical protein